MDPVSLAPVVPPVPQPAMPGNVPIPRSRGMIKKIGLLVFVLALIGILIFVAIKFVLPRLKGSVLPERKITLTWWGLWEDSNVVKSVIDEYSLANPNVTINYVFQSKEDYRERLTSALAKGTGPDIFRVHNSWVPMFTNELDALPATVMSQTGFSEAFYPVAARDLTTSKGIVGIPLMYDGLGLYVNDEIFSSFGRTPPTTWSEFTDTALALSVKDENGVIRQAGAAMGETSNTDHWQEILALLMLQNGADLAKPTGELAQGAMDYFTSFSSVYKIWNKSMPSSTIAFAAGKLAMLIAPSWRAHEILAQNPSLKFRVVPVPQLPKERADEPDVTYASYWFEGVWTRSKEKEEAWKFLKFLSEEATLEKLYTTASASRRFGEIYPRKNMAAKLASDPIVGGFVKLAPNAKSWYLASRTWDGKTGINSAIGKYFEDAVNAVVSQGVRNTTALETTATGVNQVLVQFGLAAPIAVPSKK